MYAELLGSEGVVVTLRDDVRGSLFGVGGVAKELLVRSEDAEKARQVLDEWEKAAPAVDDQSNEV